MLHLFGEPVSVVISSSPRRQEHRSDYYQSVIDDHRRIARAIESRDPDAARQAMTEHIAHLRFPDEQYPSRSAFAGLSF
jgi:DNA-binding FadR family transcriptional regulator